MIKEIIQLREQGMSFRNIAKELNSTVGKVQYAWVKFQKSNQIPAVTTETKIQKKRVGKSTIGRVSSTKPLLTKPMTNELTITYSTSSRIYCYWNISFTWVKKVKEHFDLDSTQPLVLRLYDITSISFNGHNQHFHMDSLVPQTESDWFINGLKENRSYCLDVGFKLQSGDFIAITRSNVLHTPRTSNFQEQHSLKELKEFEQGLSKEPKWVEHVSTYSYYVMNQEDKA
ncbi:DUF4912 domain-containing protein [Rossellomorea aquimaris]|uniref:DUF4912 domain-containing protein n=1 Tax=Rossellomorea aquimaris TaxID=189382 RepID=UPI0007D0B1C7|nr:DUF4912 domain-containing protein [Rossellomorea aquimaris]